MEHFATLPNSKVIGKVLRDHKPFNDSDLRLGMSEFADTISNLCLGGGEEVDS